MVDLIDQVISVLKASPSVASAVKGVYWVRPPGEGAYSAPFLLVSEIGNTPADFADDQEIESQVNIEVDIVSTGRVSALKTAVNDTMAAEGFTRSSVGPDSYIPDVKLYTKALIFTIQKGVV